MNNWQTEIEPVAPRRTREYSEAFKGKRTESGAYACPINESHGAMVFDAGFHTCIVKTEANRVCSAWTAEDLNPKMEQFVVGVVDEPVQESEPQQTSTPATGPECTCGCGERTKGGRFRPGHDSRYHARLKREALTA